jgi:hypothetical protein
MLCAGRVEAPLAVVYSIECYRARQGSRCNGESLLRSLGYGKANLGLRYFRLLVRLPSVEAVQAVRALLAMIQLGLLKS